MPRRRSASRRLAETPSLHCDAVSSEAKNLEVISKAIDHHNKTCEFPAIAVRMNPFEVERLGWDTIRGLPIEGDANLGTGAFRIVCARA